MRFKRSRFHYRKIVVNKTWRNVEIFQGLARGFFLVSQLKRDPQDE